MVCLCLCNIHNAKSPRFVNSVTNTLVGCYRWSVSAGVWWEPLRSNGDTEGMCDDAAQCVAGAQRPPGSEEELASEGPTGSPRPLRYIAVRTVSPQTCGGRVVRHRFGRRSGDRTAPSALRWRRPERRARFTVACMTPTAACRSMCCGPTRGHHESIQHVPRMLCQCIHINDFDSLMWNH